MSYALSNYKHFQNFLTTGHYFPTMTTPDDPSLRIELHVTGTVWLLDFYVGQQRIGLINLEGYVDKVNTGVRNLPVVDSKRSVGSHIDEAFELCHR